MKTSRFSRLSLIVGLALGAVVIWTEIVPSSADVGIFRGRTYTPINASIGDCCRGVLDEDDCPSPCGLNAIPCNRSTWPTNGTVKCKSQSSTCSGGGSCFDYCDCECELTD